jgi:hypothetical protein
LPITQQLASQQETMATTPEWVAATLLVAGVQELLEQALEAAGE